MSTCTDLLEDVVRLICDHEVEKAIDRINQAQGNQQRISHRGRQEAIAEINATILEIRKQHQAIIRSVQLLPLCYQFDAFHRLIPVVDALCHTQLTSLRKEKRELSKPG